MPTAIAPTILGPRALNRAMLARQLLLAREKLSPVAALERLGPIQAQLARPPFVALWSRLDAFDRQALARAIEKRQVVRGTMMRATIHLLSRRDYLALRPVLQPSLSDIWRGLVGRRADGTDVAAVTKAARAFLAERPRTFVELRDHLKARFPGADQRALAYMVRLEVPLVQVPEAGERWAYPSQASFALADQWLGEPLGAATDAGALALRYLAAFGPATARDFQSWSGLARAKEIVAGLRSKLRTFRDEHGRELFDLPRAPRPDEDVEAPVRFLPEFDNVLLAYAVRSRVIADAHRRAIATKNLFVPALFLVDGMVAGKWTVETKRGTATLAVQPFAALSKPARAALADEGERLVRFVEPDARSWGVGFGKP